MRLLLDTHTLLWAIKGTLGKSANSLVEDPANQLYFSVVNLWEIAIKNRHLAIDLSVLRENLLNHGYCELPITSRHVLSLDGLPNIHHDPFDRILLAQALSEKLQLLTADEAIAKYAQELDCVLVF